MKPEFRLLAATLAACAALSALPATAQTALRMNISVAQNSHYGVAIDTFAREVGERTNGRYKVQNFYSGALGAERESIEAHLTIVFAALAVTRSRRCNLGRWT